MGMVQCASPTAWVQKRLPLGLALLLHQPLRPLRVFDPFKQLSRRLILDARFVHLVSQPFPPVEADLRQDGKPGLQPPMQKPQLLVQIIKIEVDALAPVEFEFQTLASLVAPDKPGAARFHRADDGDQAFLDPLAPHLLPRQILLVITVALQINAPAAA